MKENKFFEIKKAEPARAPVKNSSEHYASNYLAMHHQKIKSLPDDLLRLPTEEEFFFLQSDTSFNAFTFIPLVAKSHGVKELYASTYSINMRVIDSLVQMHDEGMIEQITLMISDSMIKRNPRTVDHLTSLAKPRGNMTVLYSWNHSKVCIMKTPFGDYVVEGSGNWSENALYEQYLFANSAGLYEFRKKLFTESKLRNP